jgi:superfamily II DNA helicase RecQ
MSTRSPPPHRDEQSALLQKYYGFPRLRHEQQAAVDALLCGRDVSLTAPTGFGKSLCFALPALVFFHAPPLAQQPSDSAHLSWSADRRRGAVTIVVSPLLALIEDQVAGLKRRGVPAAMLSSGQTEKVNKDVMAALQSHRSLPFALLYVTPERVSAAQFINTLVKLDRRGRLAAFAIDESHCISQWYGSRSQPLRPRISSRSPPSLCV